MNTTEFVARVRKSGQLSDNDPNYDSTVILEEGTAALTERFMEPVTSLRQGYGLHVTTTTTDTVNNPLGMYRLPARAVVAGLEKLEFSTDGVNFFGLNIKTQVQATPYVGHAAGIPHSYVLEGDCVRLIPIPSTSTCTLRFSYYLRPPQLIAFSDTVKVATVGTLLVTTSVNPNTVSVTTTTDCDIQNADGSHEVALVGGDITSITGAGPFTINFAAGTDLSRVRVGDFIRPPDQAVFPMLPRELHRPLADYVAAVIWASKGDKEKSSILAGKAENGINRVVSMAQPRIKGNGQFTWKRNSYLRRSLGSSRWVR